MTATTIRRTISALAMAAALAAATGCTTPPPPAKRIDLEIRCEPLQTSARIVIVR